MFFQNASPVSVTSSNTQSLPTPTKSRSIPLHIPGSWNIKVTFLTYSGPGIPGADPHWWLAVFTGLDSISPDIRYSPAPPNTLLVRSNQDTHSMGVWDASSSDTATFSLVMQMFQAGTWVGNLNVHAPLLIISSDGDTFATPSDNPVQAIQYDTTGTQIGQATISLLGTRIIIKTADLLPIQS